MSGARLVTIVMHQLHRSPWTLCVVHRCASAWVRASPLSLNGSERGEPSHVCAAREIGRQVERRNDAGRDRIPGAHRPWREDRT
nr:hypothetical protein [Nitrobacter hamburgensis]